MDKSRKCPLPNRHAAKPEPRRAGGEGLPEGTAKTRATTTNATPRDANYTDSAAGRGATAANITTRPRTAATTHKGGKAPGRRVGAGGGLPGQRRKGTSYAPLVAEPPPTRRRVPKARRASARQGLRPRRKNPCMYHKTCYNRSTIRNTPCKVCRGLIVNNTLQEKAGARLTCVPAFCVVSFLNRKSQSVK